MLVVKQYDGYYGVYHYLCSDVEEAMAKLNEIEASMELWLENNPGREYSTSMLFGEEKVIIELKIFV